MITMVVAAYHRFQPAPSFHLASTSCLPIFSFLSALSFQKPPTIPPLSSEPADDRLTFGLMALAGSRRWWMTVGERQTFGAIRRFKRFFVTAARYVAAPAWPATMRQKQCWLIAFQNCERWKTVSRPPMVAATVFENGVRCSTFSFATRTGRGGVRSRATFRFEEIVAIKSSGRDHSALDRPLQDVHQTFSSSMMTRSSFRLDDSSTFLEEFVSFRRKDLSTVFYLSISRSIFCPFFFLFSRGVWDAKERRETWTSLSSSLHWMDKSVRGIIPSWAQKTNLIIPEDPANSISGNLKW